ncbi:hypothetical protein GOP47_0001617 [Adiantum capillus-veneris]|uniref:1-phosphatidylinositol-3-phosphate 5-kinase n=1 Tax=Adiantum capillus-veneris TaxID=13818 RepID=A0A9D4V9A6_ADICA|nr:hypothetical protein GOP47_0001617 [Adiantum capillus-veneris]
MRRWNGTELELMGYQLRGSESLVLLGKSIIKKISSSRCVGADVKAHGRSSDAITIKVPIGYSSVEFGVCNSLASIKVEVGPWSFNKDSSCSLFKDSWMQEDSFSVCYICGSQFNIFNCCCHCHICGDIEISQSKISTTNGRSRLQTVNHISVHRAFFNQGCKDFAGRQILQQSLLSPSFYSDLTVATFDTCLKGSLENFEPGSFELLLEGNVMDFKSAQKISRKLTPVRTDFRIFSSEGGEDSPSPYDFCNDSRSDDVDEEGSRGLVLHSQTFKKDFQEDATGGNTSESVNIFRLDGSKVSPEKNELGSQCFEQESELSAGYAEEPEEAFAENSFYASLYKEPNDKDLLLDIENNAALWVAPPAEDDEDEFGSSDEDHDNELDSWGLSNSLGTLASTKFRSKDTPAFEQRKAVVGHFRLVVGQLLSREGIQVDDSGPGSWLEVVTSLSLQAAGVVKPDTSLDGGMDPGRYVKVKCVATGRPAESQVVRGVVCKKNIAHRRMIARFKAPRLLLLAGSLEFQMVSNHLSSLQTLLKQETDHISMAISRIEAHHPSVLVVERAVSRQAQERLLEKGISLVLNVKKSLLERIGRCTGATIASNVENLSSARVGHCEQFYVEKYREEHGDAAQGTKALTKTLMFFEDCPKPFGCSILLKGGNSGELKKVKRAIKLAVFAAYHLALETSFLVDEGVDLPELCLKSPLSVSLPDRKSKSDLSISTVSGSGGPSHSNLSPGKSVSQSNTSCLISSRADSPVSSPLRLNTGEPFTSSRSPGQQEVIRAEAIALDVSKNVLGPTVSVRKALSAENVCEVSPASKHSGHKEVGADSCTSFLEEEENQASSAREEGIGGSLQMRKEDYFQDPSHEEFPPSPSNHQSILVSFSSSCLRKRTVCERGHLFRIKYYGTFDKPLGKFLQDLFNQTHRCLACGELKNAHVDCYTHRQGSLTIHVRKEDESLPGERKEKIWLWLRCLKCARVNDVPPATRRVAMSGAAWGLSFGKFLELSFSNHAAASRVASCGHSLHRDCLRFYGSGCMKACIRYTPVHVYSVYLPPSKLDFHSYEHQEWLQQEIREITEKGDHLFKDIFCRLQNVNDKLLSVDEKSQEAKSHILELNDILGKQKDSFQRALNDAASCRGANQPHADILRLNFIRRSLSNCSALWEKRIQSLSSSLKSPRSFPGFDSGLIGDSLISFLKEISFGSARNRSPFVSREPSVTGSPKSEVQGSGHFPSEKSKSLDGFLSFNNADASTGGLESVAVSSSALSSAEEPLVLPKSPGKTAEITNPVAAMGERLHSFSNFLEGSNSQTGTVTNNATVLGGGSGVHRSLSEGHFSAFRDVSATFDAAWTGESQTQGEFEFDLSSVEKDKANAELDVSSSEGSKSSSDTSDEGSLELCIQNLSQPDDVFLTSTLTSPAKSGLPSDIESWVGTPYLSLPTPYSDNVGNALSATSPEAEAQLANSPTLSTAEQGQAQEGVTASLFPDIDEPVVSVYDDEPTSVIAYAITSHEHQTHLFGKADKQREKDKDSKDNRESENILSVLSSGISHSFQRSEGRLEHVSTKQGNVSSSSFESLPDDPLLDSRASHVKVNFTDDTTQGRIKYAVTCYYAKQFDGLRKRCCKNELDFIRSLCRCKKWGAQGGKSNVFFAKTADDRFVVKQVTRTELDSFLTFAPAYFKYISDALGTGSPTCLAKILGIYQVTVKHAKGGKELRMDLMIMENLLYGRQVTRVYDLKGSLRSRYNADATAKDAVLLDQNLLESLQSSPIYISNKAKRLLERAVWNDTAFLASVDVMDYSLLVGLDEGRQELVLGIIDFMRQYTWDKHLETWVKTSGILGGPKNAQPTVISPNLYKKRFRKAMSTYFLMVPDQWSPVNVIASLPTITSQGMEA